MSLLAETSDAVLIHRLDADDFNGFMKDQPEAWAGAWAVWAADHHFVASPGQRLVMPAADGRIAAAILGRKGGAFADGARAAALPACNWQLADDSEEEEFALGFLLDQYRFDRFKPKAKPAPMPQLVVADPARRQRIEAIAAGVCLGRDLINTPANHLTPQGMEDAARELAQEFGASINVTIGEVLARDFPAIDTVGRAAESPPRLIDMSWGESGPVITLVGKGVTFDSGGLDIKPSSAMEMMKKDMGGAAIVLGLAQTIMALNLPVRLRVLVPTAENAISDKAMRPLDVIDTAAGIPVEVGNTDAEGRLILADAIHLATSGTEKPDMLIDFATLTGAARVAVGTELPALFCNDDALSAEFIAAANAAGDPLWPLPLHAPYDRYLEGGHTALSSTGSSRYGGAITAALFLQRFVASSVPWAHIDVMAWNLAARPGHPRGGEAMGLRAALRLIETRAKG